MVHSQVANHVWVVGELLPCGAAIDGSVRFGERHVREEFPERRHPLFEERRVVRPAERQSFAHQPAPEKRRLDCRDKVCRPDRDALVRAVIHRHDHFTTRDVFRDFNDSGLAPPDGN